MNYLYLTTNEDGLYPDNEGGTREVDSFPRNQNSIW